MKITRFDSFPDIWESSEIPLIVEFTSEHGLELCLTVDDYSGYTASERDVYQFLSRDEAIELAKFILEQVND